MTTTKLKQIDISHPPEAYNSMVKNYEFIDEVSFAVERYTREMLKSDFNPKISWEKFSIIDPEDWLSWELESRGLPTNFYDNEIFSSYYEHLIKLNKEGYDVKNLWIEFKNKMSIIWKYLPDFYNGLRPEYFSNTANTPLNYDKNKPFPQYPIAADID